MYRELSSREQFGTQEGPYAGPSKSFDLMELPLHVRERLTVVLHGEGSPKPLLRGRGRFERSRALYLLPLDLVETRGDRIRLMPMAGLRDMRIEPEPRGSARLSLVFEDGERFSFRVANARAAEDAYANVVQAQGVLKTLSVAPDLAQAIALDPFFAVRSEPAWNALGASGGASESRARNARMHRLGIVGVGCALTAALLFGGKASCKWLAERSSVEPRVDVGLPAHTSAPSTPSSANAAMPGPLPDRLKPRRALTDTEAASRDRAYAKAEVNFAAHGTTFGAHAIHELLAYADREGNPFVYFEVGQTRILDADEYDRADDWELGRHTRQVAQAFGMALSQNVPAELLEVTFVPRRAPKEASVLSIDAAIERQGEWKMKFEFTVSVNRTKRFTLTLPAPDKPIESVRNRSLFAISEFTVPDERRRLALFARAFDRLYDEVFGLFFLGDPVVPLSSEPYEFR